LKEGHLILFKWTKGPFFVISPFVF